ncbi:MAG: TetR/AcrR family transcriptional regulator [Clostridia bacterium]|nr:TetR/AcrR family transcriptional regulator [Clostridia bacterium]
MSYRKTKKVEEKLKSKRAAIIAAGKEVLAEGGYTKAGIKNIAQKAGIATGTFYLYFANKDKLVETIAEEMYQKLLQRIKEERAKYTSTMDKLQASMRTCVQVFSDEQQLAKILLIQAPGISKILNHKLINIEKELVLLSKMDLDELVAEGHLPEQDTYISACAFVGTFRQVIISWLREGQPENLMECYDALVEYNLRGLGQDGK